jgi:hypothetical protein
VIGWPCLTGRSVFDAALASTKLRNRPVLSLGARTFFWGPETMFCIETGNRAEAGSGCPSSPISMSWSSSKICAGWPGADTPSIGKPRGSTKGRALSASAATTPDAPMPGRGR